MKSLYLLSAITVISVVCTYSLHQKARYDFASPTNLGSTLNTSDFDGGPSITPDGLALYFTSDRTGGAGGGDLWVAKRAKPTEPFGVAQNLGPGLNSPANEFAPSISPDGLSIYFDSDRDGGLGSFDIWVAVRATTTMAFQPPRNLGAAVNSNAADGLPNISADGLSLYFCSRRGGGPSKPTVRERTRRRIPTHNLLPNTTGVTLRFMRRIEVHYCTV